MAGSAVFSYEIDSSGYVVKLQWVCTADGSGNVSTPTITQPGDSAFFKYNSPFSGVIGQARITPGTGGDQPDAAYDVELRPTTDSTIDLLGGLGDNCSNSNTVMDCPATEINGAGVALFNDIIQPYASGCGAANKFTLAIYLWLNGEVK